MLWVLKRTVSMRRFFLAPKTYAKIGGLENVYKFMLKIFVYLKDLGEKVPLILLTSPYFQLKEKLKCMEKNWVMKGCLLIQSLETLCVNIYIPKAIILVIYIDS